MDLFEAIHTRITMRDFKTETPPREFIETILSAGTRAPNYHLTEPWRFVVLAGNGRDRLAEAIVLSRRESLIRKGKDPDSAESLARIEYERNLAYDAPVCIAVAVVPNLTKNSIIKEYEEIYSVAAAIQNMLLAAHALGLGAMWRTAGFDEKERIRELFGLGENDTLIGFIRLGYPDGPVPLPSQRTHFSEKTEWWGI